MSVVLITNMFPDNDAPHLGTFVRDTLEFFGDPVDVVYPGNSARDKKLFFYASLYSMAIRKIFNARTVIVHYPMFFLPLVAVSKVLGKRIMLVYHGGEFMHRPGRSRIFRSVRNWIFRVNNSFANRLLVPTNFVANEYFGSWAAKTVVWYSGGIDRSLTVSAGSDRPYVFGYFGRLEAVKGHECYIGALKSLAEKLDRSSSVDCLLVCRDYSAARVETVQGLRIHHLPPVSQPEVLQYLRRCEFVVIPSYAESLCLLALEAANCGAIVIARRLPALEETLDSKAIYFDDDHELVEVMEDAMQLTRDQRDTIVEGMQGRLSHFDRKRLMEELSFA